MPINGMIGWETFFSLYERDIKSEVNIIIATLHWYMIKNSFLCLGLGDDRTLSNDDRGSELLPIGWDENEVSYIFRYCIDSEIYVLKCTVSEESLICVLLKASTSDLSNIVFDIKNTVKNMKGTLKTMIPNIEEILQDIKTQFLEPVLGKSKTKTSDTQTEPVPLVQNVRHLDAVPNLSQDYVYLNSNSMRNIGRGDLDPLGRFPGGMLFDPDFRQIPSNIHQPPLRSPFIHRPPAGARFDPINPIDPNRIIRGPDNDHFAPPGYDDMFM